MEQQLVFGPVPSRRLGRSLGLNNIPPKECPYSCVYCQLGRTVTMQARRRRYYDPEVLLQAVRHKLNSAQAAGEPVDFLTFVPDGEPTLDLNLGHEIELLRPLGIPLAVITCAALIWREDVRAELARADWVSLKIDAVGTERWRRINRPYGRLRLAEILDGAREFAAGFAGKLVTETMLVAGLNDAPAQIEQTAAFVARLRPATAYLAIPTRPPAEPWVRPPAETGLTRAYQLFSDVVEQVEYLIGYEGNAFSFTGDIRADLLGITAVHPLREDAVRHLLARAGTGWAVVDRLLAEAQLVQTEYQGHKFYVRKLPGRTS